MKKLPDIIFTNTELAQEGAIGGGWKLKPDAAHEQPYYSKSFVDDLAKSADREKRIVDEENERLRTELAAMATRHGA